MWSLEAQRHKHITELGLRRGEKISRPEKSFLSGYRR
jgi:hypothetical protein